MKAKWNLGYNATDKIKKLSETVCTAMLNSSGEAGDVSNVAAAAVVKMSAGSSNRSELFHLWTKEPEMVLDERKHILSHTVLLF